MSYSIVSLNTTAMKLSALIVLLAASAASFGQFSTQNTTSFAWLNPAFLGGGSGNDCWGYVSPSGREYALMGQVQQTSIVEITNPASPVVVAHIPHSASTWSGIKTYKNHAYVVTEAGGSGVQVLDLSQVDNGQVTLVRTISNPGSSHTIAVDETSGFLYTCGSRGSSGTTMCFDLTNPANPVRVGANSLTTNYMHETQVVTYTSGPNAGKQIFFGFSEGRGLDIYDVTNKNAPVMLSRGVYPSIGYCHQGWLSADKKYIYIDDEFDETNLTSNTRSIILNVENLTAPQYVGTFSSGTPSIDHNQYWDDGFLFQANYRSGLRIFDAKNPTAPVQVGYFDTYPTNDSADYSGAWSNYPFFPSGTVIISDINRGLFVINTRAATTRSQPATSFSASNGVVSGNLAALTSTDTNRLQLRSGRSTVPGMASAALDIQFETYDESPTAVELNLQSACPSGSAKQTIRVLNVQNGIFEIVKSGAVTATESMTTVNLSGAASRFVNPLTKKVTVRAQWQFGGERRVLPQVTVNKFEGRVVR